MGLEQTALEVAAAAAGTDALAFGLYTTRIVKAGRKAPFVYSGEVLSTSGGSVACRTQMVDAAGDVVAICFTTHHRAA